MRGIAAVLFLIWISGCEPSTASSAPPILTVQPVQTWDFPDGPWGSAGPAVVDSSGASIVGFSEDGTVLFLEPTGAIAWRHAGNGSGPGEFLNIGAITLNGDTVYVSDYAQQRIVTLLTSGDLLETRTAQLPGFGLFYPLKSGELGFLPFPSAHELEASGHQHFLRVATNGEVVDTLLALELQTFQLAVAHEGEQWFTGQPLSRDPIARVSPHGDLVVKVDRDPVVDRRSGQVGAIITWIDLDGNVQARQPVEFPAITLTQSMRDSLIAETLSGLPETRAFHRAAIEQIYLPETLPPVTNAVAGDGGEVWLRGAESGEETITWIGVSPDSGVVGALRLPVSARILGSSGCELMLTERDALDVEKLILARVC